MQVGAAILGAVGTRVLCTHTQRCENPPRHATAESVRSAVLGGTWNV